ncbi:PHD finger domain protein [Aspergillus sp. HF37]|nr:PHD finger domain protein [Aspergillus sp. HF37]
MVTRKRARSDVADAAQSPAPAEPEEQPGLLHRLRNCWEFANLMQFITMFGRLMKIDEDFEIDDLENECLKTESSEKLLEIGLCLLKWVSSHRGLTFDNFDEYTRRQYNAKAPHLENPFGYDEEPRKFVGFDVFLKLRVLHQLSVWTFWNPDRIRSKMPEQRETDQTQWRIEELGYDRNGRYYFVLDDNRLYRRTDPPIPARKPPKSKSKGRSSRAQRASKRRKVSAAADEEEDSEEKPNEAEDETGGIKWECVAVTYPEYNEFLGSILKTKDADEKILRDRIVEQVMPVIEQAEDEQERKRMKREKEIASVQLMAGAKRSSRLAQKTEKERVEREAVDAARKHEMDLANARKEQDKRQEQEHDREFRVMTREQRLKDREQKQLLHEAELERISEDQKKLERGELDGRISERYLQTAWERQKKSLENLSQEDQWTFDCSACGVHGENLQVPGISQSEAESEDFHFICKDCKRREEEAKLPKLPPLKFKVGRSSSPGADVSNGHPAAPSPMKDTGNWNPRDAPAPGQPVSQPSLPLPNAQSFPQVAPSPERRRPQAATQGHFASSPPRAPFSPAKSLNGLTPSSREQPAKPMADRYSLPPNQQAQFVPQVGSFDAGSFPSQRRSSSHAAQSPNFPSPIRNRPSMSPTQGNHDVGPLAGFPLAAPPNGTVPFTPSGQRHTRPNTAGHDPSASMQGTYPSFSAATPSASQSSPPQSSHGVHLSGISPTKNSNSPRPLTSGGAGGGAPVLPPIQALEPSPKLMGRSSPDAPVPSPTKCMTPDQEKRKQRENA